MAKTLIEDCMQISASRMTMIPFPGQGTVTWGDKNSTCASITVQRRSRLELALSYSIIEQYIAYRVNLNTTLLPWDRDRHWFTCPKCGRRVAHLYKPNHQLYFLCRHCHHLAYKSQRANRTWLRILRAIGEK